MIKSYDGAFGFSSLAGLAAAIFGYNGQKSQESVATSLSISSAFFIGNSNGRPFNQREFHIYNLIPLTSRIAGMATSKIFDLFFKPNSVYTIAAKSICTSLSSYVVEKIILGEETKTSKTYDRPFTTSFAMGAAQAISYLVFNQRAYEIADKILSNIVPPVLTSLRINPEAERSFRAVNDLALARLSTITLFGYGLSLLNAGKTSSGGLVVGSAVPGLVYSLNCDNCKVEKMSEVMINHAVNNSICEVLRKVNPGAHLVNGLSFLSKPVFKAEILELFGNPALKATSIRALNHGLINMTSSFLHQLANSKDINTANLIISGFASSLAAAAQVITPIKLAHGVYIDSYSGKYKVEHDDEYVLSKVAENRFNLAMGNIARAVVYEIVSLIRLTAMTNEDLHSNDSYNTEEFLGNKMFILAVCRLLIAGFDNNSETKRQVQEKMPGFIDEIHRICHELAVNGNKMSYDERRNLRDRLSDVRHDMEVTGETDLIAPSARQVL